jgi:hypothetical protein
MESDRDFLDRFESGALSAEDWTHEARLRATFLFLRMHDFEEAIRHIRIGVAVSKWTGGEIADGLRDPHETLILAWARLIEQALAHSGPPVDFADFLERHPGLRTWERVLDHYSPERLRSDRAHREFVLPDRAPLPAAPRSPAAAPTVRNSSRRRKDSGVASPDPAPRPPVDSTRERN